MDIGSSKIRVIVLSPKNKKNFEVMGVGESAYAGYRSGEFLEPDKLKKALEEALTNAQNSASFLVKELYVGVPADFLVIKTKQLSSSFAIRRKVREQDTFDLMDRGNDLKFNKDYTLIAVNAISYKLDNGRFVMSPENNKTQTLSAHLSYEYGNNECIRKLNACFEEIGLASVDYVSAPLAEFLYLLDEHARKDHALIVDSGYSNTHVLIGKNKGLVSLHSFALGGGHMTADLAKIIHIDFEQAEKLKRKAILVSDQAKGGYEVTVKGEPFEVPAAIVSDIIKDRIDLIAKGIEKAIELSGVDYPKYLPVFLTGGGFSLIKGAKEYLTKQLDRPIEILAPKVPQFNKPQSSSLISLAHFATEKEYTTSHSFLAKLLGKW